MTQNRRDSFGLRSATRAYVLWSIPRGDRQSTRRKAKELTADPDLRDRMRTLCLSGKTEADDQRGFGSQRKLRRLRTGRRLLNRRSLMKLRWDRCSFLFYYFSGNPPQGDPPDRRSKINLKNHLQTSQTTL
jgi:hypothetical protein